MIDTSHCAQCKAKLEGKCGTNYVLMEKDFVINILRTLETIKKQVHMRLDNKV